MSDTMEPIESAAEAAELIADRRDFHRHPELGYEEHRTARVIAGRMRGLGYDVQTGVGRTGVVGLLERPGATRTLLYRADTGRALRADVGCW